MKCFVVSGRTNQSQRTTKRAQIRAGGGRLSEEEAVSEYSHSHTRGHCLLCTHTPADSYHHACARVRLSVCVCVCVGWGGIQW